MANFTACLLRRAVIDCKMSTLALRSGDVTGPVFSTMFSRQQRWYQWPNTFVVRPWLPFGVASALRCCFHPVSVSTSTAHHPRCSIPFGSATLGWAAFERRGPCVAAPRAARPDFPSVLLPGVRCCSPGFWLECVEDLRNSLETRGDRGVPSFALGHVSVSRMGPACAFFFYAYDGP